MSSNFHYLQECVRGVLKDKTILLVTHQVDFLHKASQILVSWIRFHLLSLKLMEDWS